MEGRTGKEINKMPSKETAEEMWQDAVRKSISNSEGRNYEMEEYHFSYRRVFLNILGLTIQVILLVLAVYVGLTILVNILLMFKNC